MIRAYFDGMCEPNRDGGKMAYGAVIYKHEEIIHEISHVHKREDDIASNNIAEYCGLISVLKYLIVNKLIDKEVYIFGDSKLVIEQMKGNWLIKEGKYIHYAKIAEDLLKRFKVLPYFEWIPKERNTEADRLSRKYYG